MAHNISSFKGFLYVTLLFAVLCVISAEDKLIINLKQSGVTELRNQARICEKETGVPADTLKKLIIGTAETTANVKTFLYCVAHNTGFVDKTGHLMVDNMLEIVSHMVKGTKEEFVDILNKCNEVTLENNIETTNAMSDCLHKNCDFTYEE